MSMRLLETSQTISDLAIYNMLWHEFKPKPDSEGKIFNEEN